MNERNKGATTTNRQVAAGRAQDFVRGVYTELRRVTWPSREEWVSATALTIALVIGIGLFVYGADQLFGFIFSLLGHAG